MKLRNLFAGVLALIIAFAFAACTEKENEKNDQVSDFHSQNTDGSNGNLLIYLVLKESVTYDSEGQVTQRITVEDNEDGLPAAVTIEGERAGTITYTYNGKYAVASLYYERDDGRHMYFEFTDFGENAKRDEYKEGEVDKSSTYAYDDGNRLISRIDTEPGSSKADKTITYEYKLNDQGLVVEELEFVNGEEYYITEIEYDDEGRELRYSGAYIGKDPYIRVSEYDENGNIVKSTEYTADTEDACTTYTYDDQDRLLKSLTIANGEETAYVENTYDGNGNLIKHVYYSKDMGERHYEYEYGQNNALCKRFYYIKGELTNYTEFTWFDRTVSLEKNVGLAIDREFSIMEEK